MAPVVAVVGGGVVGLTTAVKIQQQIPSASVRIISDQWSPDITRSSQHSPSISYQDISNIPPK